jgi:hypothetical protein
VGCVEVIFSSTVPIRHRCPTAHTAPAGSPRPTSSSCQALVSLLLSRVFRHARRLLPAPRGPGCSQTRAVASAPPAWSTRSGPTDAAEQALSDVGTWPFPSMFPWVRSRPLEWAEDMPGPEAGRRPPWPDGSELFRGKRLFGE